MKCRSRYSIWFYEVGARFKQYLMFNHNIIITKDVKACRHRVHYLCGCANENILSICMCVANIINLILFYCISSLKSSEESPDICFFS